MSLDQRNVFLQLYDEIDFFKKEEIFCYFNILNINKLFANFVFSDMVRRHWDL